ncbi:MAG: hypothetical protein ACJASV_000360 [Pseudorhodobacter sp.]
MAQARAMKMQKKDEPSHKNLCHLRAALFMAQEMGAGLGRGSVLLCALSAQFKIDEGTIFTY